MAAHEGQPVPQEIEEVLLTRAQIAGRVCELARQISRDYAGKELRLIGVLNGAVVFLADLMRCLSVPCTVDFVHWTSYGADTVSSGVFRILKDLQESVEGRHLLVVEDIIDTGLTLSYLLDNLQARGAASVKVAAFLDKPSRREAQVQADYLGFEVPDEWLVGYGLDYAQRFRNLPFVGVLRREVYEIRERTVIVGQ